MTDNINANRTQPVSTALTDSELRAIAYFSMGVSSESTLAGKNVAYDLRFAGNINRDEPRVVQEALDRYVAKSSETQLGALRRLGALNADDAAVVSAPLQRLQDAFAMPRFPTKVEIQTVVQTVAAYQAWLVMQRFPSETMFRQIFFLPILLMVACSANAISKTQKTDLCSQVRKLEAANQFEKVRVPLGDDPDSSGSSYFFDLSKNKLNNLKSISAVCGDGSYSECEFKILKKDNSNYIFNELSKFGLIYLDNNYYLVYRIINPKNALEKQKRRIVKVGNPPQLMCNNIGDYSDLM